MILRNFDELIGVAKVRGQRVVAVARADDPTVLEGLECAANEDLVEPILFGNERRIKEMMESLGIDRNWAVVNSGDDDAVCAREAIRAVREGDAQLLMKGQMHTSALFKAVLDKDDGLPREGILSHIAFVEIGHYHKLFAATDGGLNVAPDHKHKIEVVRNAIRAFHTLGYKRPKVALLSYIEKVKSDDPETTEWADIAKRAKKGDFGEAIVEGPLAMDLCLSEEAKRIKNCVSEVAADADVIVSPNITACNASTKALLLAGGLVGGVVVGSSAPIVALSRGDSPRTRLCSLAVASALLG